MTSQAEADDVMQHPAVVRVRAALQGLHVTGEIVALDGHARTAAQAAEQLGVSLGQIASSLVFAVPDPDSADGRRPLLVITSGAHRVDTDHVASLLELETLENVDARFVRKHTGFVIGGVPPVGHLRPLQTLVDVALAGYDQVWAAAGHPRTVFPTRYDELLRITAGHPVEVD